MFWVGLLQTGLLRKQSSVLSTLGYRCKLMSPLMDGISRHLTLYLYISVTAFLYLHLCICICIFSFVYMCLCICICVLYEPANGWNYPPPHCLSSSDCSPQCFLSQSLFSQKKKRLKPRQESTKDFILKILGSFKGLNEYCYLRPMQSLQIPHFSIYFHFQF